MAKKMATKKSSKKKPAKTTKKAVKAAKKAPARKAAKRELIDTGSDKRFVRRGAAGQFKESDDVGKAAASDQRMKAKTKAKRGQGDKGDR